MNEPTLRINGWSLRGLAHKFPAKPPASVQQAFNETLKALHLNTCKYRLVYIPNTAIRHAARNSRGKSAFDFMYEYAKAVDVSIGSLGQCVGKTAFVVQADTGGKAVERATAVHEALHFVFGPHPWPHERTKST